MPAPYPQTLPQAFAQNAAALDRNTIPNMPLTTQRASFNLGFPPLTMAPVAAGGKPMLGPDMNGILYMMSTHAYYQQSGKLYLWNADVLIALGGGYAIGTLLGSTDGLTVWFNTTAGNVSDPDVITTVPNGWVALFSYGMSPISGLVGGVRTLNLAEASKSVLVMSGTLVANQQVVLPPQLRRWLIANTCTGAFSLTVKTAGVGTGVVVPQGGLAAPVEVYGDGVNIYNVVAPVNLPIDQAATPFTIVQRTNVADVFARYFNSNGGADANPIANVFYDAGDGYLRKISLANFQLQAFLNAALTGVPTAPTAAVGTNNTQIASTQFVQANTVGGPGQVWTSFVSPARQLGVVYTNTTGRPIQVNVYMGYQPGVRFANLFVDGVNVAGGGSGGSAASSSTLSAIVPAGSNYVVVPGGGPSQNAWAELR